MPAQLVVKEMQRNPALGYTPIGLLDDDPRKRNLRLHGVRVLGTVADLDHVVRDRRPDEILIAIPTAPGELRARIVETARSLDVPVKTLPSLSDLVSGDRDLARQLRPVEVEDVLGREPVDVDIAAISDYLAERGRPRHRRRRLDRRRAVPPDRAPRARQARAARQRRAGAVRDRARARPRPPVPRGGGRRRRRQGRRQAAPGLRQVPARVSCSTRRRTSTSR